jgi:hypothetical protein
MADNFFGFSFGPCQSVWSSLGRGVGERLAVGIEVESIERRIRTIDGVGPRESDFRAQRIGLSRSRRRSSQELFAGRRSRGAGMLRGGRRMAGIGMCSSGSRDLEGEYRGL